MHLEHHSRVKDLLFFFWEDCQKAHKVGDVFPQHQRSGPSSLFGGYERVILLRLILDRPGIIILV
jgi:hypothetical protein